MKRNELVSIPGSATPASAGVSPAIIWFSNVVNTPARRLRSQE